MSRLSAAYHARAHWIGIPDVATMPSALFLGIWFAAASLGLAPLAAELVRVAEAAA